MAEGVIKRYGEGTRIGGGGSDSDDRKRAREDHPAGPSTKRRTGSTAKSEKEAADACAHRVQALQVSRVNYSVLQRVAPDKLSVYIGRIN